MDFEKIFRKIPLLKLAMAALVFQGVIIASASAEWSCEEKLSNCTAEIQPVLNEARYMFPVNHLEIESMCRMWSHIMDCIRKYMSECSSEEQKLKFNEAVSDSIDSVHAICSSERYRKDYLENAMCFKRVSIESCGTHFRRMVDSAYNPQSLESHICCAYGQYEKCASEPIQRLCGPQTLHLLDHSMASLKSRCDIIMHNFRQAGHMCPVSESVSSSVTSPQKSPRMAAAQTYNSLTTTAYSESNPNQYTTLSWTPRTVIYPLPVTRHSSRISKNADTRSHMPSAAAIFGLLLLHAITLSFDISGRWVFT